jgi:hypothetical protein
VRSIGGWSALKTGKGHVRGDQRILGDSEFVLKTLKEADEHFARVKAKGHTLGYARRQGCLFLPYRPICYAVMRGKLIAQKSGFQLEQELLNNEGCPQSSPIVYDRYRINDS